MSTFASLSQDQQVALDKLSALVGPDYVGKLLTQETEAVCDRLETFMKYEASLRDVHRHHGAVPTSSAHSSL